jgi:hypothetical protein
VRWRAGRGRPDPPPTTGSTAVAITRLRNPDRLAARSDDASLTQFEEQYVDATTVCAFVPGRKLVVTGVVVLPAAKPPVQVIHLIVGTTDSVGPLA